MPRADQRLYAALLRMGRQFKAERLPLLGVAGTDAVCYSLDWPAAVRQLLEAPPVGVGLSEGAKLLARLQQQLDTLLQAEDQTREALADWASLADSFSSQLRCSSSPGSSGSSPLGHLPPASAAAAVATAAVAAEEGLVLLTRQTQELADPLQLELDPGPRLMMLDEPAALSLNELTEVVRQQHGQLFATGNSHAAASGGATTGDGQQEDGDTGGIELRLRQVVALQDVFYRQQRFKYEPFEWVYEGLQPVLLPPQLQHRKLAPLTLAVAVAGVARRLGLPLLPVPAEGGKDIAAAATEGVVGGLASQGQLPLEQLQPDVAQRYAGQAQGVAPAAGPWVLLLADTGIGLGAEDDAVDDGSSGQRQWPFVVDACTGEVLDASAAQQRYPELQLAPDWRLHAPLVTWQHMVRTIVQAHQRRGESDLVAHWVYVLLALDPQAAEWEHMLHAPNPLAHAW